MVYHSKDNSALPKKTFIEPIIFLSQLLMDGETQYWPTELKTAGLVWTIRKVCHMVKLAKTSTMVYTDHAAIVLIARQTNLTTTTTRDKLNLRIIRALKYFQRFNLNVCHKSGKTHIIPNTLSCLASHEETARSTAKGELDALAATVQEIWANLATLVELSNNFKEKLKTGYKNNPGWKCVKNIVSRNHDLETNAAKLPYQIEDDLIYYKNSDLGDYPCIPGDKKLLKQVFSQVHEKMGLVRYAQAH